VDTTFSPFKFRDKHTRGRNNVFADELSRMLEVIVLKTLKQFVLLRWIRCLLNIPVLRNIRVEAPFVRTSGGKYKGRGRGRIIFESKRHCFVIFPKSEETTVGPSALIYL